MPNTEAEYNDVTSLHQSASYFRMMVIGASVIHPCRRLVSGELLPEWMARALHGRKVHQVVLALKEFLGLMAARRNPRGGHSLRRAAMVEAALPLKYSLIFVCSVFFGLANENASAS